MDDIFAIVTKNCFTESLEYLNSLDDKVNFTVEEENDGVLSFLDVLVTRQPGRLLLQFTVIPSATGHST